MPPGAVIGRDFDLGLYIKCGAHFRYIDESELRLLYDKGTLVRKIVEVATDIKYTVAQYEV